MRVIGVLCARQHLLDRLRATCTGTIATYGCTEPLASSAGLSSATPSGRDRSIDRRQVGRDAELGQECRLELLRIGVRLIG